MKQILHSFSVTPLLLMIVIVFAGGFYSCSSGSTGKEYTYSKDKEGKQTLIFFDNEDGKEIKYEAGFEDGELVSLLKDGTAVNDSDLGKYSDLVADELGDMRKGLRRNRHFTFEFDGDKLNQKFRELNFRFDSTKWAEHMGKMGEHLSKLKKIEIDFNSKEFQKDMERLKEGLDHLEIEIDDIDIDIDMDEINSEIDKSKEEIRKSMEEIEKIDLPGVKKEIIRVKKDLKDVNKDLKRTEEDLNKFEEYIDAVKEEMVKDNLIKSKGDDISIKLDGKELYVNDKKVEQKLTDKYMNMYKEKFGRDMDKSFRIRIH